MNETIGFIGTGSQGAAMARRIADAGCPPVLWARRAVSLTPYADTAAEHADHCPSGASS
ncbi:MAG: NAD(P)-binding domain-containing protein [Novosphingobium sp.]